MFNVELKKEALRIHEETLVRYNNSYEKMKNECENWYTGDLPSGKIPSAESETGGNPSQ